MGTTAHHRSTTTAPTTTIAVLSLFQGSPTIVNISPFTRSPFPRPHSYHHISSLSTSTAMPKLTKARTYFCTWNWPLCSRTSLQANFDAQMGREWSAKADQAVYNKWDCIHMGQWFFRQYNTISLPMTLLIPGEDTFVNKELQGHSPSLLDVGQERH